MVKAKLYVLGFVFDPKLEMVVLIQKKHPAWQAGKLNGVGGKIETGESPVDAMGREFYEETGVQLMPDSWDHCATLRVDEPAAVVYIFRGVCEDLLQVRTTTDEKVVIRSANNVPKATSAMNPNLRWIIPMLADPDMLFKVPLELHAENPTGMRGKESNGA